MATDNNADMGFPGKVAEMAMNSVSMFNKSPNGPNPNSNPNHFFGSGWDPLISMSQSENFGGSSSISRNDYPIGGFSHLVRYQSDSGLSEMVPKIPCFSSNGALSEMVSSFGHSDCGQITNNQCPQSYPDNAMKIATNSEEGGKKKRRASDKNIEGDEQKDNSEESSEQEEKKHRIEQKQSGKQIKDNADNGEAPPKENYMHVRAKRGQATNSHSLAERVRRERISERMRLLQELVPGCNKITGKAVMLDEIINYVQSLQQQVEFLSMKLATVNPEVNIDMERVLSKDIIHSNASILGFNNSPHPHPYSHSHTTTNQPFNPLTQIVWDNELQTLLQMRFDANPNVDNMGPNGDPWSRPKPDL